MNPVDKCYTDNYDKMVKYVMNRKRGGDHITLSEDDAYAVVHTTYIYHRTHMDKFVPGYVWNKLMQMRKNFLRDDKMYDEMKDGYKHILDCEHSEFYEPISKHLIWWEEKRLIDTEIKSMKNEKHKGIVTKHIQGDVLSGADRKTVTRFRTVMNEKYGDV